MERASAILVKVTWGRYAGRLAVAVERDGRWLSRFDNGLTFDDVDPAKFQRICRVEDIEALLSVLD